MSESLSHFCTALPQPVAPKQRWTVSTGQEQLPTKSVRMLLLKLCSASPDRQ